MMFISKEDEPAELREDDGISRDPSGGLFVSLNGAVKIQYDLNENWKFVFETSSGNLMDFYAFSRPKLGPDQTYELTVEHGLRFLYDMFLQFDEDRVSFIFILVFAFNIYRMAR